MADTAAAAPASAAEPHEIGGGYARYVLFVLVIVYVFNFIDRQILSILNEEIKADLGISDADMGFLFGTAFAVFYAIFGIPLGRLADVWVRKSLISVGLAFWSVMTAMSGTARSFPMLAFCRFGVGIGEASASPAAFSMLSDYFPPRLRATALAIYSSGVYIGAGIGVFLGGLILDTWNGLFPDPATAPFGLKGWQAAFFAVGLPGVVMALWVRTLKEPVRGLSEGLVVPVEPHPFRETFRELVAIVPPFTLLGILRAGGGGIGVAVNAGVAAGLALIAWWLVEMTGAVAQWVALAIGIYATASWVQSLALNDRATFRMIFGSKTLLLIGVAFPCIAFVTYGVGYWGAPFFLRVHGISATEAGTALGLTAAAGGWIGVTLGGVVADWLRQHTPVARLWVGIAVPFLSAPFALVMLNTDNLPLAYFCNFMFAVFSPMWVGCAATTVQDLVMPRMRAIASAFYILMVTFIGLAMGPYLIGQMSDAFAASGMPSGDALRRAMELSLLSFIATVALLVAAMRFLPGDESSRLDRARAAGEPV